MTGIAVHGDELSYDSRTASIEEQADCLALRIPPGNEHAHAISDNECARTGEIAQCLKHMLTSRFLDDRDADRKYREQQQKDRFRPIAGQQMCDAADKEQPEHWLMHDFEKHAQKTAA